jgi:hypothetical protein
MTRNLTITAKYRKPVLEDLEIRTEVRLNRP